MNSGILCVSSGTLTAKSVVATRGPTEVPVGNRNDPESAAVPQRSCGSSDSRRTTKAVVDARSPLEVP
jgi:hypothetical protein